MSSPLDFFGSAPDAPQTDANERVVLARADLDCRDPADIKPWFKAEPWAGRPLLKPRPFYTALCSNSSAPNERRRLSMRDEFWAWAYLLMVDDVGTRIDPAKLRDRLPPPTVINETSSGNFQWLWGYASKVNPADQRAALLWLADEGLTDKKSVGVHRLCRIPSSTSYKSLPSWPDRRPAFAARVVEFHPDRLYPFADLVPVREGTTVWRPPEAFDPRLIPGDDVYQWLGERGLIAQAADRKGWSRLTSCPWVADHDRNASHASQHASWRVGRFGSFHCFGCRHDTRDFVLWLHGEDPAFRGVVRYALAYGWDVNHG
jgi:hypothetical protein